MCQRLGVEHEVIPRVATAFGGGMGGTGAVCGAVVGAVMAIGLRHGRAQPSERDARAYGLTQELRRRFEAEMGMDLSTAEGVKRFYASDVPKRVCLPAVGAAYRIVTELLES